MQLNLQNANKSPTSDGGSCFGLRMATTVPSGSFHNFSCTAPKRKRLTACPFVAPTPMEAKSVRRQMEKILSFRLRRGATRAPTTATKTVVSECKLEAFEPVASRRYCAKPKTRRPDVRVLQSSELICGRLQHKHKRLATTILTNRASLLVKTH